MEQPPKTAENPYGNLTEYLDRGTELAESMFMPERIEKIATMVAHESMLSFKQGFGTNPELANISWSELERTFYKATRKAAERGASIFNGDGSIREGVTKEDYGAIQKVEDINREVIVELAQHIDPSITEKEVAQIIQDTDFFTIRSMVASQLGVEEPSETDPKTIVAGLKAQVAGDAYSEAGVDDLIFEGSGATQTTKEMLIRRLAFGLANATWKTTQGFRASYEKEVNGTTKRGNSVSQSNYLPFNLMVSNQYEAGGIDRAVLEVDKDRSQLSRILDVLQEKSETA